jgi:xylan 1,4-beta-xylosidase
VRSFPEFQNLPVVLSEADPEGCAACSARVYPPNAYRNGTLYPSYTAAAIKAIMKLADRDRVNLGGILTWAFEFEDQPYFDGLRTLATNGIDKPVLNLFRMVGLMHGDLLKVEDSPPVGALVAGSDHQINVLVWNYQDDDVSGSNAAVDLRITGIPSSTNRVLLQHFRIDADHSNSYTVWKRMGSPQNPTPNQYRALEAAEQVQLLESPRWIDSSNGATDVRFSLPLQGISLLELTW